MLPTLLELQRLKRLERTGWSLRGLPNGTESVAAHTFGVSITAMILADELIRKGVTIDVARLLRMALLHDWAETRVGDMPRTATAYFGAEARRNAERAAFADIVDDVGDSKSLYSELHSDYEERRSLEARLVKVADVVDLLLQAVALERAGAQGLDEFWEVAEARDFRLDGIAKQTVDRLFESILDERRRGS